MATLGSPQSRESNGVRNKKSKNLLAWTRNTHNQEGKEKHSKNKQQQIKFLSNRWGDVWTKRKEEKKVTQRECYAKTTTTTTIGDAVCCFQCTRKKKENSRACLHVRTERCA
jgi:hypothetical protein